MIVTTSKASRLLIAGAILLSVSGLGFGKEPTGGKASFLKSLLIPGWGQFELNQRNTALAFIGTELTMIGGILAVRSYGASTRDDYEALAAAHAGIIGDHGHDFYVDVGNWMTVDEYNEARLRDRDFDALYTSGLDRWAWDSDANRARMEKIRINSDRAFNSVFYFVGGLVLNHVASAIHAGRLSSRQASATSSSQVPAWAIRVLPFPGSRGVRVGLSHSF